MAQLIVRDVDEEAAMALHVRVAANGRSAEAEHRQLLRDALAPRSRDIAAFAEAAARMRFRLEHAGDSADLVRAVRDERFFAEDANQGRRQSS